MIENVNKKKINLLAVVGPTASGKTALAVALAKQYNGEIISADSRQVYRGLDIGSGKDLQEYGAVPYHLIDIVDPGHEFNVYEFQQHFIAAFTNINSRNKLPLLVGGTGLYLAAALKGYHLVAAPENPELRSRLMQKSDAELIQILLALKPEQHNTTDIEDRQRLIRAIEIAEAEKQQKHLSPQYPAITPFVIGIHWERNKLRQRITQRLKQRLEAGLIEEVQTLHEAGIAWETLYFYGLEYRYVADYLQGKLNKNDMYQKLNAAIHDFAKKQDTWFRRMQRDGMDIHWLNAEKDLMQQVNAMSELALIPILNESVSYNN